MLVYISHSLAFIGNYHSIVLFCLSSLLLMDILVVSNFFINIMGLCVYMPVFYICCIIYRCRMAESYTKCMFQFL